MQPTSTHGAHGRSADPTRRPSPLSLGDQAEQIGETSSRRRVRSRSPEPRQEPASFHGFTSSQLLSVLASPVTSLSLTDRDAEPLPQQQDPLNAQTSPFLAPEGGPVRKAARRVRSSIVLPPLTTQQQPPSSAPGIGFVFGTGAASRGENKSRVTQEPMAPAAGQQAIASGQTFSVTAQELAALSASSSRPLVVRGSSSDGRFLVAYADPVAAPQGPGQQAPAEPRLAVLDLALAPQVPQPAVNPQEAQELAPHAQAFDPVASQLAKTLRSRLRKALASGTDAKAIYRDFLRPAAGNWDQLKDKRQAFTPEFLVAVLLVLPSLANDDERTVLGQAVGELRVPAKTARGRGTLGRAARAVIGQALAHEAVQARVPLDALMVFLTGANAGGARQWHPYTEEMKAQTGRRGVLGDSRNQFTGRAVVYGIAQALAGRLARQAQEAGPAQLDAVLATATRLGSLLGAGQLKGTIRKATLEAVASVLDGTSLPPATKTQLKDRFSTAYCWPGTESGDELSDDAAS
ncbi:MAG: hypothetical protein V4609_01425 [Pseudomonadota bacterium]